jgi:hypothetical protein
MRMEWVQNNGAAAVSQDQIGIMSKYYFCI